MAAQGAYNGNRTTGAIDAVVALLLSLMEIKFSSIFGFCCTFSFFSHAQTDQREEGEL